jgi:uncharacterized iron-regulated membrane protein
MQARPKPSEAPAPPPRRKDERPPAPWGSFPLVELAVLFGLVMLVIGAVQRNILVVATGLVIGAAAGLELSVREHFSGYRSHTTLLAGSVFVVTVGLLFYFAGLILAVCLGIGAIVFAGAVIWLRRAFQRASGGLSFKVGGLRG